MAKTCKWCKQWQVETHKQTSPKNWETIRICAIGKLNHPGPDDTCDAWELDQELVDQLEKDEQDWIDETEGLRRGYG